MANREVSTTPAKREPVFDLVFRKDLIWFIKNDRKAAIRSLKLVEALLTDPFIGIGKPEPLRMSDTWSRKITLEHRLVYKATADRVYFPKARYH